MCGIAGILHCEEDEAIPHAKSERVLELLKHRGPDNQGVAHIGPLHLFHSRLSIIDTSEASNQPFVNAEGTQALVFNGEVYNYSELQKGLTGLKTDGDVEVLFRLLQQKGDAALPALNGFFAFAYYNKATGRLLLARDRFGVKPLYYYRDQSKFVFASELKPLLELAGPQVLDQDQLYSYFRLNYTAGEKSIFKNVYRLQPGHCLTVHDGKITLTNWYQVQKENDGADGTDKKRELSILLDDAVRLRLQADVPVGTFLSGGIDSSIISALAKRHKPDLETFSIGFSDEHYFDETSFSELVARHIDSRHHVIKLREDDFLEHLDAFLNSIDEPFADSSAFNFYMLSLNTRRHVKVALSGDGADELFKGYNKHRALMMTRNSFVTGTSALVSGLLPTGRSSRNSSWQNKVRQFRKFSQLAQLPAREQQQFLAAVTTDKECRTLLNEPASAEYFESLFQSKGSFEHFELKDSFDIQTVLCDDMLVKADRFSMRHGVEIRNPFLDYRVVELAMNLPESEKINARGQKLILRDCFSALLPAEIFNRSKKGFELPLQKWLTGKLKHRLDTLWLDKNRLEAEGWLNYDEVRSIRDKLFSSDPGDSAARLWAIIVFENWLTQFKDYIRHHD